MNSIDKYLSSPTGVFKKQALITEYEELGLNTFDFTEHKGYDIENNIDPVNNFLINYTQRNCEYYTVEQFNKNVTTNGAISIIHFNSRSLKANISKIKQCLKEMNNPFTVIAISETWLKDDQSEEVDIEGYERYTLNRKVKRCGGVALFIDKNYKCKIVKSMSQAIDNIMECITVEIEMESSKNILVSCVYRCPGSCIDTFSELLSGMYERKINTKMVYVCGDYNIDLLNPLELTPITEFINLMYSMSLYPAITRPTRITSHSATIIDNIFTNVIEKKVKTGLIINDSSDHLPVFAVIQTCTKKKKDAITFKMCRKNSLNSVNSFKNDLLKQDWKKVYVGDTNEAYNTFVTIVSKLYDKNCPLVKKVVKHNSVEKPWLTKGILNACKKKNLLYKDFLKIRTKEADCKYKTYKNKLIKIMRNSKRNYYSKILEDNKNNIINTWKVLNEIIKNRTGKPGYPSYFLNSNNITIDDFTMIAEEFNDYFVGIGPTLAEGIAKKDSTSEPIKDVPVAESMVLSGTNEKEIIEIVKEFKGKKSTDCNGIDMSLVKNIIECVVKPLTHVCNQSLTTGVFPSEMKTAKIIPIYKAGDKHIFSNYRPISLLPQFSKILEKIFYKRLDDFITKQNILCDQQYGFRKNRTTTLALLDFVAEITTAIENKQYVVGVFLDLKKAFDTVNYEILLTKLESYGIRGMPLTWLTSYLTNRNQYVQIMDCKSKLEQVKCGVPQGSILGPLLFILYVNDMCKVSRLLKAVVFADDTNLLCCGDDLEQLLDTVGIEMKKLQSWFDTNKLTLNLSKTKYIIFGNRPTNTDKNLTINNIEIERVNEIKFLGVIIDNKLSWKPHIMYIKSKMSKSLAVLYKVKDFINQSSLYTLYCSFILPYIIYCVEVWGNTYKTNTDPIFILQKKAIRIVTNADYREPTNPLFIKLNTLKFNDLVDFKTIQLMFKVKNDQLPNSIQGLFEWRENTYYLRGTLMFKRHFARTNLKLHCITVKGVELWNTSSEELKNCSTLPKFKKMYKNNILSGYRNML